MRGITPKIWEKFVIFLVFLDNRFGIFGTIFSKAWYFLKIWTWSPWVEVQNKFECLKFHLSRNPEPHILDVRDLFIHFLAHVEPADDDDGFDIAGFRLPLAAQDHGERRQNIGESIYKACLGRHVFRLRSIWVWDVISFDREYANASAFPHRGGRERKKRGWVKCLP